MGGLSSKAYTEGTQEHVVTPSHVRTVAPDWDPRSPSHDIIRTPIQVEMTPADPCVDPRSPSVGIVRTPIFQNPTDTIFEPSPLVLSQSLPDEAMHSPTEHLQDDLDLHCQEGSPVMWPRCASEPDISLHDDSELLLIQTADAQVQLSFGEAQWLRQRVPQASLSKESTSCKPTSSSSENPSSTETSSEKTNATAKPLLNSTSEHQRSPLSTRNVDMNSPLAIVQRKQANRLNLLKGSHVPAKWAAAPKKFMVFHDDKENIDA